MDSPDSQLQKYLDRVNCGELDTETATRMSEKPNKNSHKSSKRDRSYPHTSGENIVRETLKLQTPSTTIKGSVVFLTPPPGHCNESNNGTRLFFKSGKCVVAATSINDWFVAANFIPARLQVLCQLACKFSLFIKSGLCGVAASSSTVLVLWLHV
ncbi:hypothetical protein Tco_0059955 [Tanacetum coccineum]